MSYITIDWRNDRTISYLMLRYTRGDGVWERKGEKMRGHFDYWQCYTVSS